MSETDAWSAGFWEGEGSIWVSLTEFGYWTVRISASQIHPEPLEKLQQLHGGKVRGPYKRSARVRKQDVVYWRWECYNQKAIQLFIRAIFPYVASPNKRRKLKVGYSLSKLIIGEGARSPSRLRKREQLAKRFKRL